MEDDDSDNSDSEQHLKLGNYLEHTLFVGLMPDEDGITHHQMLSESDQQYEL